MNFVGAAESSAVDDATAGATSQHSRLKSKCGRSNCVGVDGYSAAPPAHTTGVRQPRLPRREDLRKSQRQKPLSIVVDNKLCRVWETERVVVANQMLLRLPCWNPF